jgi:hypothetical protein
MRIPFLFLEAHMPTKPYDPTVKTPVETSPGDWPVLLGQAAAPTEVIEADIATVSGAGDKVLRVRASSPYFDRRPSSCLACVIRASWPGSCYEE